MYSNLGYPYGNNGGQSKEKINKKSNFQSNKLLIKYKEESIMIDNTQNNKLNNTLESIIQLGIDQTSIVLKPSDLIEKEDIIFEWVDVAEEMKAKFETNSDFISIFGECNQVKKGFNGYDTVFEYGNHSFLLKVAYHSSRPDMGLFIYFSSQALSYYCNKTNMQVHTFLQMIQDELYTMHLTRIDLTSDYINMGLNVTTIYNDYINNETRVYITSYNEDNSPYYKKCTYGATNYTKEADVQTMYLGTRKSDSFLRVYDKKIEQLNTYGTQYDKAQNYDTWIRFECELKGKYAHQLSEELLKVQTDEELANLIANTILQKYSFFYIVDGERDTPTEYTQALIDYVTTNSCVLKSSKPMNYELAKSLEYLFNNSGLPTTLYKIKNIYGENELDIFFDFTKEYLRLFRPNRACDSWLKANKDIILENEPNFKEFLNKAIDLDK